MLKSNSAKNNGLAGSTAKPILIKTIKADGQDTKTEQELIERMQRAIKDYNIYSQIQLPLDLVNTQLKPLLKGVTCNNTTNEVEQQKSENHATRLWSNANTMVMQYELKALKLTNNPDYCAEKIEQIENQLAKEKALKTGVSIVKGKSNNNLQKHETTATDESCDSNQKLVPVEEDLIDLSSTAAGTTNHNFFDLNGLHPLPKLETPALGTILEQTNETDSDEDHTKLIKGWLKEYSSEETKTNEHTKDSAKSSDILGELFTLWGTGKPVLPSQLTSKDGEPKEATENSRLRRTVSCHIP